MPVPNITTIVQTFAGCSSHDAERAARAICRDPEAVDLLVRAATQCGIATSGVGLGWMVISSGLSPVSAPMLGIGAAISATSAMRARRFCAEMVEQWDGPVSDDAKQLLRE